MPLSPLPPPSVRRSGAAALPSGRLVDRFGGRYYEIAHAEALPVFFMNIATASDLWLFVASNGGLTAGRVDSDHALFPYQPVDRIYDSAAHTGPVTAMWIQRGADEPVLWEPFAAHTERTHCITRNVLKSVEGDRVWFEEINHDLRVSFRYGWSTAAEYGLIRTAELENLDDEPIHVRLLDGLRHLLVPGVTRRLQEEYSCLAVAYKMAEQVSDTTLAVYALASGITDRPVPMESLLATIAWCEGLPEVNVLLSETQLRAFLHGEPGVTSESLRRGVRASYLVTSDFTLPAGTAQRWLIGVDTGRTATAVTRLQRQLLSGSLAPIVEEACLRSTRRLRQLVGAADGLQTGGDEVAAAHHFANVLFNVMRGGVFQSNHEVLARDFAGYVELRQTRLAHRHAGLLAQLPERLSRAALVEAAAATGDGQLERLALEYLPLIFSRRHGDPSRPWNRFRVCVGEEACPVFHYEGNWRDIFQNWEALGLSFPEFLDGMVATFVNASTIDGYNPYRITRQGIEWEVPNPEDPWSSIGYWGDHQVIYLLKLMEVCTRFFPGRLGSWLRRDLFTYANVPYRIVDYDHLRRDPRHTIRFVPEAHAVIEQRVAKEGADARLVLGAEGAPRQVNLTEKLLLLVLVRLVNFVPGGGIWMNTQRPEWNDGNNALVGAGVSVVTLAYLRRFLAYLEADLMPELGSEPVVMNDAVANLLDEVARVLERHECILTKDAMGDDIRRTMVDELGAAGSSYRETVYACGLGSPVAVEPVRIRRLLDVARRFVDHTLRSNRRADGLYHAYNVLEFVGDAGMLPDATAAGGEDGGGAEGEGTQQRPSLRLRRLPVMLEGQVAILSAGLLEPNESVDLLVALRRSELYRAGQDSYLLQPDRERPGFLARGVIPRSRIREMPWLAAMMEGGDARLVEQDEQGVCRFAAQLVNAEALDATLEELANESWWASSAELRASEVRRLYEDVFQHHAFTGRSGAMFGYEGLGSIYWHMVSKLLLAVQENLGRARCSKSPAVDALAAAYEQVRRGLGFCKDPVTYGAFPTDPYSHTPAHAGAQQPGMTGQVKEEILARWSELGVTIANGRITLDPTVVAEREFSRKPVLFRYVSIRGEAVSLPLGEGSLAFTVCGTPIVYRRGAQPWRVEIEYAAGKTVVTADLSLDSAVSASVFARSGAIRKIEITATPSVFNGSSHETRCEPNSSAFSSLSAPSR